jgi:pyruvate formate lyase activating enzyme
MVVVRVPLIPGCNDDEDNIRRTAEFVRKLPKVERLDLLPYHRLGEPKYRRLAVDYSLQDAQTQPKEVVERLKAVVEDFGLRVRIGG